MVSTTDNNNSTESQVAVLQILQAQMQELLKKETAARYAMRKNGANKQKKWLN